MTDQPLDCVGAMKQLFDYLDGELTPDREAAVRAHIAICALCYPHYEFEKIVLEAITATRASVGAPGVLRARVLGGLREAGFKG
jgi:anti-sigma factor (TIGR02949 family)